MRREEAKPEGFCGDEKIMSSTPPSPALLFGVVYPISWLSIISGKSVFSWDFVHFDFGGNVFPVFPLFINFTSFTLSLFLYFCFFRSSWWFNVMSQSKIGERHYNLNIHTPHEREDWTKMKDNSSRVLPVWHMEVLPSFCGSPHHDVFYSWICVLSHHVLRFM